MKKQAVIDNTLMVGIDVGYGVVKAVSDNESISFPSVAGYAREIKFQAETLADRYPGDQLTDDDGKWFIGNLALSQVPAGEMLRLRGRTVNADERGNAFRVRMVKAALAKMLAGTMHGDAVHIKLVTGLPVDHMRDRGALVEALSGQHIIKTDSANFIANVIEVRVMPQPYGTIFRQTLTSDGQINGGHTPKRTGVIDVGTYTVDVTVDQEGEYIDAESGSVESGVYTAQQRIESMLEARYRQKFPFATIEEVLREGKFNAYGAPVYLRDEVNDALAPMRAAALALLDEKWKSGATLDVIYLSGGGAPLVLGEVMGAYPQAKLVKEPQLANARGYLQYCKFKARNP